MKLACGFILVAAATAAAVLIGAAAFTGAGAAALPAPTAKEFARDLAGTANAFGVEHAKDVRLVRPDCVQASRGHYMCSFTAVHRDGSHECHLIQARWTPDAASTITVTLSGRVNRCRSLRDALDSLG